MNDGVYRMIRIKRRAILIITSLMVLLGAIPAYANSGILGIDNGNVYSGMTKSYAAGYKPTAANGKTTIVLPLVDTSGAGILGDSVVARINLGDTSGSPFVYANYEKTVALADNPVGGGASTVSSYLVQFDIPLASGRINGTYPTVIDVSYTTAAGVMYTDSFTVYVTISDGTSSAATTGDTTSTRPRPEPKVIIENYTLSEDTIMAGDSFDIDVSLFNTQNRYDVYNVLVTYAGETADIMPAGTSNAVYIDKIESEESEDITLHLKARADAEEKAYKVVLSIGYENSQRTAYTVTEEIYVEVKQPIRLEYDAPDIPDSVNAGDSIPIAMQVMNKGKSTLYNVQVTLDLKGAIPDASAYLGNLESGTADTAEIYAFISTLNMDDSSSDEMYGYTSGQMVITYEDAYGNPFEETIPVETVIEKPIFESLYTEEPAEEEKPKAGQWWVSIIILAAIGAGLYGYSSYKRKIDKLKREYGDEDL